MARGAFTSRAARRRILADLFAAQRGICAGCGVRMPPLGDFCLEQDAASIDHVIPRSRGGGDHIGNMLIMHRRCNGAKADHQPNGCDRIWHDAVLSVLEINPADMVWSNARQPGSTMMQALFDAFHQGQS